MNKTKLIKKHVARKGYDSKEPWEWGIQGYSGYSCLCGCGLTIKDLKKSKSK